MSLVKLLPTKSLDEVIDEAGFGKYQLNLCIIIFISCIQQQSNSQALYLILPSISRDLNLKNFEKSLIGFSEFLGFFLSSILFHNLADKYGRRKTLIYCVWLWLLVLPLSMCVNNIYFFCFLRTFQGFATMTVGFCNYILLSESVGQKYRGIILNILSILCIGSFALTIFLALYVFIDLESLNWRLFLGLFIVGLLISQILNILFLEESPRFSLFEGDKNEGYKTIEKMYKLNYKNKEIIFDDEKKNQLENWLIDFRHKLSSKYKNDDKSNTLNYSNSIFSGEYKKITYNLLFTWLAVSSIFIGVEFILPMILNKLNIQNPLKTMLFLNLIIMPFTAIIIIIVESKSFGRKNTLTIGLFINGISGILLFFNVFPGFIFWLVIVKLCYHSNFMLIYLYTTEMYPTVQRAFAMGRFSAFSRIGQMITPWFIIYLYEISTLSTFLLFGFVSILAGVCIYRIPYESAQMERII